MAICWDRAVPLALHLCCFNFSAALVVHVPFPFGVWGMMWNSILLTSVVYTTRRFMFGLALLFVYVFLLSF